MRKLHCTMLVASLTVSTSGCLGEAESGRPNQAVVSRLTDLFNADLGDEGVAVSRRDVQKILEGDPSLLEAVQDDLSDGFSDLLPGMIDLNEIDADAEIVERPASEA